MVKQYVGSILGMPCFSSVCWKCVQKILFSKRVSGKGRQGKGKVKVKVL